MRYPGEVRYYDPEPTLTQSVFSGKPELTTWPYGGFHLEAMDAHGGWVGSAIDLARFASALQSTNQAAILDSESLSLMFNRPESTYYAYGWRVRPMGKGSNWWSTGSMPGSSAILYRRSDGLIWVTLFNTQPNSPGDEFLVDVITVMGQAAIMDEIVWISVILLVIIIGIGIFFVLRRRKRLHPHRREM
jgi:CubicO group peptidase (beta-lactamase class C family)